MQLILENRLSVMLSTVHDYSMTKIVNFQTGNTDNQCSPFTGGVFVAGIENSTTNIHHHPSDGQIPAAHVRAQHHHHSGHSYNNKRVFPRPNNASDAALDETRFPRIFAPCFVHETAKKRSSAMVFSTGRRWGW